MAHSVLNHWWPDADRRSQFCDGDRRSRAESVSALARGGCAVRGHLAAVRKLVESITGRPFLQRQSQEPTYEPWLSRVWSHGFGSLPTTLSAISLLGIM